MSNLDVSAPLVNGDLYLMHERGQECHLFVKNFLGDDLRPPPRSIVFELITESGHKVKLVIPNGVGPARTYVDDNEI